ncbi:MAG: transcriptional regulator [Bradyrhizobium sp.]|nr:transcriptional regulator [Bradyrhizobium sp.]
MDHLTDMAVFVRVVEKRSFTAAAKELQISTSAVSKHVARLEKLLLSKLLDRNARVLTPTEAGRVYYDHCRPILAAVENARSDTMAVNGEIKGVLRVHSTFVIDTHFVAQAAMDMARRFPDLLIDMTVAPMPVDPASRGVDVVVSSGHSEQEVGKSYDAFLCKKLGVVPYTLCAAPSYFAKHGLPKVASELRDHRCLIHVNHNRAPTRWGFIEDGVEQTVTLQGELHSTSAEIIKMFAVQGLGIALLPRYAVSDEVNAGHLVTALDGKAVAERIIRVYYGHNRNVPRKVRMFVESLEDHYNKLIGADK